MAVSVTPQMIRAGWAEVCTLESMASAFMGEDDAAPMLAKVYQAMHAAGPEAVPAAPPPAEAPAQDEQK